MALWLTALKIVPWVEVVTNAPKVVDGARRLWDTVTRKTSPLEAETVSSQVPAPPPPTMEELLSRIHTQERLLGKLQNQMIESSELIKSLAEQNTRLIESVESMRVRSLWLIGLATALAVLAIVLALAI